MGAGSELVSVLVGFARALRKEGLVIGSGQVVTFCEGVSFMDPGDLIDIYWAGRGTLLTRNIDIETYEHVFQKYFMGKRELMMRIHTDAQKGEETAFDGLESEQQEQEERKKDDPPQGLQASTMETLKRKRFGELTAEEQAAIRKLMHRFRLVAPQRRTRRLHGAPQGRYHDLRKTIRRALRTQGDLVEQHWKTRRVKPRRLVFILDISGSMTAYSRALLQFAYSASKGINQKVEVFCFGTRLTRITEALKKRNPDEAIAEASKLVTDWEGGTKIGASLDKFVKEWGRRGLCRGAIVVICSDGLERGDPAVLDLSMERLRRLSHKIVWMNPLKGNDPDYEPVSVGMMCAMPYVDELLSGHDLKSLEELAEVLPKLE
ncbi:MAG: vWA domain-containing protein [Actinomycetota bacterium]